MITTHASNFEAWNIKGSDFPKDGDLEDKLKFLLRYAILAPSGPNSQPWKFAINENRVSVYADLKRALPFVDPINRTLYMSVGCAIANLLLAGRHFGFLYKLDYFPEGLASSLVAKIGFVKGSPTEDGLFDQITRRHTVKDKYEAGEIDWDVLNDLLDCINDPNIHLYYLTGKVMKSQAADIVSHAHHIQLSRKEFRRNLGDWLRNNWTTEPDGMPLYTFGVSDIASLGFPAAFKEFDLSEAVIYRDSGLINGCSSLGVLSSEKDDRLAWTRCGVLLERYILKAAKYDIWPSFFSQPIAIPELREELKRMTGPGYPQILFSLGYAKPVKHTPRRALEDVLIKSSDL
ncbi:MAG: hypothetical protein ACE14P_05320 [Methanotrichaceae archaeon]